MAEKVHDILDSYDVIDVRESDVGQHQVRPNNIYIPWFNSVWGQFSLAGQIPLGLASETRFSLSSNWVS